jgi:hypothetical protein
VASAILGTGLVSPYGLTPREHAFFLTALLPPPAGSPFVGPEDRPVVYVSHHLGPPVPDRAAEAVRLVGPGMVIPMHYGTFPVLTGTPEALTAAVKKKGLATEVKALGVHETRTF